MIKIIITIGAILCIALLILLVIIRINKFEKQQKFLNGKKDKYTFPNATQNKKK